MSKSIKKENRDDAGDRNHELYGKGCKYFDSGDFRNAIGYFKESLDYWPEDGEAWFALGNCYEAGKKPRRAEKCFRKALEFGTEKIIDGVWFNLGNSLYDQRLFEEALECYKNISKSAEFRRSVLRNIRLVENKLNPPKPKSNKKLNPHPLKRGG